MFIFCLILFLFLCYAIHAQQKKIEKLEQENAALRKRLQWKGVFASDLQDE